MTYLGKSRTTYSILSKRDIFLTPTNAKSVFLLVLKGLPTTTPVQYLLGRFGWILQ